MACPDPVILEDLALGHLPAGRAAEAKVHVAGCAECARKVALALPATAASAPPGEDTAPPPEGATPELRRGDSIGRYLVVSPIGAGGMGVVYLAYDPALDRRVAIKFLRPAALAGQSAKERGATLLREAHAMAKLSHPNVVPIHDVGTMGDQVFLAMDFVEGQDLRGWLGEKPRSWREILAVYLDAGRGLEAAHAAGMIHRDFKPDNVLIDASGRALVTDFGIARAARSGDVPVEVPTTGDAPLEVGLLQTPMTRAGFIRGTPGYMSPEQTLAQELDARSDEYSFCVSLHESLFGGRGGRPRRDPALTRPIPRWLRRALARGMAKNPANRFPSMTALLAALGKDRAVLRRRLLFAGGVALLALVSAGFALELHRRAALDVCYQPEGKLAGIWDEAARGRVRQAFAATGAADALVYAERAMDRASDAWLGSYRDACEATRVKHAQPEAALHLRIDCLRDQGFDLRAAAELLSQPDPHDLAGTIGAALTLPLPSECGDAHALSIVEPPDPAHLPEIQGLRLSLARGQALVGAGKGHEAIQILQPLPERLASLGAAALQARALGALAAAYATLDDYAKAAELFMRTEDAASAAHLSSLAATATASAANEKALLGRPPEEVAFWLDRAREAVRHAGPGGPAEFALERALGSAAGMRGKDAEAALHDEKALEIARAVFGNDRHETILIASDLSYDLQALGSYDACVELLKSAIASSDRVLGPKNPQALAPESNLAPILFNLGRFDEAQQALARLYERLGTRQQLDTVEAITLEAALESARGQRAESLRSLQKALALGARLDALASANNSDVHWKIIEAYLRDGEPKEALRDYQKYLAPQADLTGVMPTLRLGGWAYLDAGQPKKAIPLLERALQLGAAHPYYPGWVPRLRYQLAKALMATHHDRKRAASLAVEAHDELAHVPVAKELLAEVDAWRGRAFKRR